MSRRRILPKMRLVMALLCWQVSALTIMLWAASLAMERSPAENVASHSEQTTVDAHADSQEPEREAERKLDLDFPDFSISKPWR